MKKFFSLKNFTIMLLLCLFFYQAQAQQKFIKTDAQLVEIKKLKAKVEANPADLKAHEAFISIFQLADPALQVQYEEWEKQFPKIDAIPFAIGKRYVQKENPEGVNFLLEASRRKPENAETWYLLSGDAFFRGNITKRQEYLKKAMQLAPANSNYAFDYASSFKDSDTAQYNDKMLKLANQYPNDEIGDKALFWLSSNAESISQKKLYYQQLYNRKSNQELSWYVAGMKEYTDLLLNTDIDEASAVIQKLALEIKTSRNLWKERALVASSFVKARELLKQNQPQQALALTNQISLGSVQYGNKIKADETLALFKAEAADAANRSEMAFDTLATIYNTSPTIAIREALYKYGGKLGKNSDQIAEDIARRRAANAKQATSFILKNYLTEKKSQLSDYNGKVVLLTYWFPGCGPCREEFPHFENVLKMFDKSDVAYLGLNIFPSQDVFVLPFMKASGYTFTPLQDNLIRNKGNLPANAAPTNYLIDQKGRIVFSNFQINAQNEKTLELMIKETLAAKD